MILVRRLGSLLCGASLAVAAHASPDLSDSGRALYFGSRAFAQSPRVAGVSLARGAAACVNCHGALGQGSAEGGQRAPAIAAGMASASSPREAAAWWLRAATLGQARDGRALGAGMPRYRLDAAERAALAAYAAHLGQDDDVVRGVTPTTLALGMVQRSGFSATAQAQVFSGVEKAFARANAQGGVHGRRLLLRPVHTPNDARDVLALVAGLAPLWDEAGLAQARLPSLASLTRDREPAGPRAWQLPLLPSLREQADMLARTLEAQAAASKCHAWLLDPDHLVTASSLPRHADLSAVWADLTPPDQAQCPGLLTDRAGIDAALAGLAERHLPVPGSFSLAALSAAPSGGASAHQQVLPLPLAVATQAQLEQRSLWSVLGEAAGQGVVEALARSGRLLQPEILLAQARQLGGYVPLALTPLRWSRTQAHGWPAELGPRIPPSTQEDTP